MKQAIKPKLLSKNATQVRIPFSPQPRGYPAIYPLRDSCGWGLFAEDGSHRGACLGHFYPSGRLTLYGVENFANNGGLAWQFSREHRDRKSPWIIGEAITGRSINKVYPTSLHNIWPEDILACGLPIDELARNHRRLSDRGGRSFDQSLVLADKARAIFAKAWDRKHGAGSWKRNPWVWVVTLQAAASVTERALRPTA